MDGEALFKQTMKTVGIMVGSCVAFVGTLTLIVLLVVSRAVGPSDTSKSDGPTLVPASKLNGQTPPEATPKASPKKSELRSGAARPT